MRNSRTEEEIAAEEERVRMEREVEAEMARQVQEMREELARYSFYYYVLAVLVQNLHILTLLLWLGSTSAT
jgi:hypothetical protein